MKNLFAFGRLLVAGLVLLAPVARAQCNFDVAVTPAGPLTLCAGGSRALTAAATMRGFNGEVLVVLAQPDGKILVAGTFTAYNGDATIPDNLVRLNADGSWDATFNVGNFGYGSVVNALALDATGKVLVGGFFFEYSSSSAPWCLIRLNPDGSRDTSFNGSNSGFWGGGVSALAVQPNGKVLVGGGFYEYNGAVVPRGIVRLNADGSYDASFNGSNAGLGGAAGADIRQFVLQPDGKLLVGGYSTNYNGTSIPNYLVRFNSDGSLDTSFNTGNSGFNGGLTALALQPDGRIIASGHFDRYNGAVCYGLVRLQANGALDTSFTSYAGVMTALAVQPDGKILTASGSIYRLAPDGSPDAAWPAANFSLPDVSGLTVTVLIPLPSGKLLAGGRFDGYNGASVSPRLLRLNADASQDLTFNPLPPGATAYSWNNGATGSSITVTAPGLYQATATGGCTAYSNTVRVDAAPAVTVSVSPVGPVALPSSGSQLLTATATTAGFNVGGSGFGGLYVTSVLALPDGKTLVGGDLRGYNGNTGIPEGLVRLNADGSYDATFNAGGTGFNIEYVWALVLQPDGKIVVGGDFTAYNGNAAAPDYLVRLNANGSLDTGFNAGGSGFDANGNGFNGARGMVVSLALEPDGQLIVGGRFSAYNGTAAGGILRLNANGSRDPSFNPAGSGFFGGAISTFVTALTLEPDGQVLVGGNFTSYNGTAAGHLLRLNADGSRDVAFNSSGVGCNDLVRALVLDATGRLLVGGDFTAYNGAAVGRLLRLTADGSRDASFNGSTSGFDSGVNTLALEPDGQLLVGGGFTAYNGNAAAPNHLLRLNTDGSLDAAFNAGGTGFNEVLLWTLGLEPDGQVLVGGWFSQYNGANGPRALVRLNPDGSPNNAATALPGATFVFNPGGTSGNTRTVNSADSYTATATDPATGCAYVSNTVVVTVAFPDLTISTGTLASPVLVAPGTYNNITVTSTGVAVLSGDVAVNGAMQIDGTLADGCHLITGPGTFALAAGGTLAICRPRGILAVGDAQGNIGLVRVTGGRSFSSDANYVYNGSDATGSGLPAQVRNLSIVVPGNVALSAPTSVAQALTLSSTGNLVLGSNALTLRSSASGTALVVNSGTGVVSGGTATVQRYLTTANAGRGYRHYSSPVSGNAFTDLATGTFTPVFSAAYNAATTAPLAAGFPTVLGYDQGRMNTTAYTGFDRGWFSPAATANFVPGTGYAVNIAGTELVAFTGILNTGDYARILPRATGSVGGEGLHLVGNPYPAPLDWDLVTATDRPGIDAAFYVFESTGQYTGSYRSAVNGVGSSAFIGSSQGFFVRVTPGQASGTLTFRNTHRLTDYATQVPMRRGAADVRPLVQLALAGTGGADNVFIYAEASATPGTDAAFDAVKMANPSGLNLSSAAATGEALAIDGRPAFVNGLRIPLALAVPVAGSYTLTAPAVANLPAGLSAYLDDHATGTRRLLAPGTAYAFVAAAAGNLAGRFALAFGPAAGPLANAAGLNEAALTLAPNPARTAATLTLPAAAQARAVTVADALGRVVRRAALPAQATALTLDLAGLAPGVYTVRCAAATARLVVE